MFISREDAEETIKQAIYERKKLKVTYQHRGDGAIVTRTKAPFDIGSTNPRTYHKYRDCAFMFCYEHIDERTGENKPMVHAVNITQIISITESGETFDPNELTDINQRNTNYDYHECGWAVAQDRNWY